jgi:hypothetical protein
MAKRAEDTVSKTPRLDVVIDTVATVLMGLATVATAWCGFEASIWGGIQTFSLAEAQGLSRQSVAEENRGRQVALLDISMFMNWLEAKSVDNERWADFLYARFRPPMREALEAWLAEKPFERDDAPPSPFAMESYVPPGRVESQKLARASNESHEEAAKANSTSDRYVLATVALASVVFFGGTAPRLRTRRAGVALLAMGVLIFVAALVYISQLPVSFVS